MALVSPNIAVSFTIYVGLRLARLSFQNMSQRLLICRQYRRIRDHGRDREAGFNWGWKAGYGRFSRQSQLLLR